MELKGSIMSKSITKSDLDLQLEPGILNVICLRVVLERHGRDNCEVVEHRLCHYYKIAGSGDFTDIDLFRVINGRLICVETLRGFTSIAEVEE
jgi:hypothetical protein